jgi:hypothetical protein
VTGGDKWLRTLATTTIMFFTQILLTIQIKWRTRGRLAGGRATQIDWQLPWGAIDV